MATAIHPALSKQAIELAVEQALELYLHSDFQPDAAFFDGEIRERPVGEDDHSSWQGATHYRFVQHAREWNIRVRSELCVQVTVDNYRVPDVSILDAAYPKEKKAMRPPLAVFEIWSPENKDRGMMRKFELYEQMGIPQIWLLDPADPGWQRYENGRLVDRAMFSLPE